MLEAIASFLQPSEYLSYLNVTDIVYTIYFKFEVISVFKICILTVCTIFHSPPFQGDVPSTLGCCVYLSGCLKVLILDSFSSAT